MLILDADFSEKLKSVLADPEAMSKITAIASNLGLGNTPSKSEETQAPNETLESVSSLLQNSAPIMNDPRLNLLYSLKPFLREEKRSRVDALANALNIAAMMKNLRK